MLYVLPESSALLLFQNLCIHTNVVIFSSINTWCLFAHTMLIFSVLGALHLNVLQRHRAKIAKDLVMWLVSATMFLFAMYVGGWATWLEIVKTASPPMTQGCATTATDQAILLPRAPMTRHATVVKRRGPSDPRLHPLCNICNISGHFARQCVS